MFILITEFPIAAITVLTIIEVAHIIFLNSWNSKVFAALTRLIGTVTGIVIGSKDEVYTRKRRQVNVNVEELP